MLRYASYDIVFQELPDEVTLAINLSNCPNRCPGCHSPHLQEEYGDFLDEEVLIGLLERYGNAITCVCFMGGDDSPGEVEELSVFLKRQTDGRLKTGWYSGRPALPEGISLLSFDYVKLGPYVERLGGLEAETTNQRLYRVEGKKWSDITYRFRRKSDFRAE